MFNGKHELIEKAPIFRHEASNKTGSKAIQRNMALCCFSAEKRNDWKDWLT
jgi:hypothetical protein